MLKKHLAILGLAMTLSLQTPVLSFADTTNSITMEIVVLIYLNGVQWIAVMVYPLLSWLAAIALMKEM